jgi:hypothetical protein
MGARNRSASVITETDEKLIAGAALIGLNGQPRQRIQHAGKQRGANALYPNANTGFWRMLCTVASLNGHGRSRTAFGKGSAKPEVTPVDSLFAASALI